MSSKLQIFIECLSPFLVTIVTDTQIRLCVSERKNKIKLFGSRYIDRYIDNTESIYTHNVSRVKYFQNCVLYLFSNDNLK